MTTPINSLQIVVGKLFSKLLQIIILLAISLPILAIVRVFGGVPWFYIFSSFCITLSAAIFAGSISLLFSIKNAHTYVVIIKTFFTLVVIYLFLPLLLAAIWGGRWINLVAFSNPNLNYPLLSGFIYLNPLGAISLNTTMMMSPAAAGFAFLYFWPVHCVMMLIASAVILAFSVKVVRKVALRQILGELDLFSKFRMSLSRKNLSRASRSNKGRIVKEYEGTIREVTGLPVLWKEVRKPIIQGIDNTNSKIGLIATIVTLLLTYLICYKSRCLDVDSIQVSYVLMFIIIGTIFNVVLSVSCITSEKESFAWPILLTTSLDDWQIIQGKALGVFYRCLPVWLLLAGHVLLFVFIGYIHPIAIIQLPIILSGLIIFLTGTGLYLSSCFKRTTWAIITSFAFILVIWMVVPIILRIVIEIIGHDYSEIFGIYFSSNPVIQIEVVMNSISGTYNAGMELSKIKYSWPFIRQPYGVYGTTKMLLFIMFVYSFVGIIFARMAKSRIRRNVF